MTLIEAVNTLVAVAALGVAGALWWVLRSLRPWRRALVTVSPGVVSGPLSCVAGEMGMLPWVFATGAASRLSVLVGSELLTAILTGVTAAVTGLTAYHLFRAARCVRRAVREASACQHL